MDYNQQRYSVYGQGADLIGFATLDAVILDQIAEGLSRRSSSKGHGNLQLTGWRKEGCTNILVVVAKDGMYVERS